MNHNPSVSVVIPCFNDGRFLTEALESVLFQTLQPNETLIINDGSTDIKTIKLLRDLDMPGVRVIHQNNLGLSAARNAGIRNATSKYVYFLDADNRLYPNCLSTLTQLLEENLEAIAAASKIRILGGSTQGSVWCEPYNPYILLVNNQWDAGIMVRKEAVKKYGLWYDESMRHGYEDWELNLRLANTGKPLLFWPEPLYQYRVRLSSLLGQARTHHNDILDHILRKHIDLYKPEHLIHLKRHHAPALLIQCSPCAAAALEECLADQTFSDWIIIVDSHAPDGRSAPYRFYYSEINALRRLPTEALEGSVMALEALPTADHCVIAVKSRGLSWFASSGRADPSENGSQPVAIVARHSLTREDILNTLSNCQLLLEFPDQQPESHSGWPPSVLKFSDETVFQQTDLVAFRKRLSRAAKQLLGSRFQQQCIRLYDATYGALLSDKSLAIRARLRAHIGERAEQSLSKAFYAFFLMQPPTAEDNCRWKTFQSLPKSVPPLFLRSHACNKIAILIVTAWIDRGGVEQIILQLCRLLDKSRFSVIVATTLPGRNPWDHLARETGVLVYHLADLLKPNAISKGLVHLILNQTIDCLYLIHSRAAYESVKLIKRLVPWLSILDRSEVLDPGGGFPLLSAQAGNDAIDMRTVGHRKLADHMSAAYGLPHENLRVIYAGTDMERIQNSLSRRRGRLHAMCQVSSATPIVTFVGRFTAQKRPEVFIRSAIKCLEMGPESDVHFAMIGDGELRDSAEHLVAQAGLNKRIHLLGAQTSAIDLLADSTLLLMPSAYEGLALVSYEAMSLGIPQIFANVNGEPELITPETGILIENGPGEEIRYAKACLELLSDPERRTGMAEAGKERIEAHFTAEKGVKQYAAIFENMAELSRKRAAEMPHLRPPHINPLHDLV
jgi:glycosyltransferase involved in cell wall biosynthesis/GT2 family glycosyltransferase